MPTEESLQEYRDAVLRYPHLDLASLADSNAATRVAPSAPGCSVDSQIASGLPTLEMPAAARFPPEYEIVGKIAETRLSRTWKVFHRDRKVQMVIKEPLAAIVLDPGTLDRFRLEVQLVSRLRHPNIVPIYDTHLREPPYYYAMPFIDGTHLYEHCLNRRLKLAERLRLFLTIGRAISYAHQHGVLHRDLKPQNILVAHDGIPFVLDFGLGRILEPGTSPAETLGNVVGTPGYMAPEQAAGLAGDTRTDVYALGVILYQLVTDVLPVEPASEFSLLCRRIQDEVPLSASARNGEVGPELNAIIMKSLAKRPDDRYASAGDLARDIENLLSFHPVAALSGGSWYSLRRWVRRNAIAVAVGTFVVAGVLGFTAFAALLWHRHEVQVQTERAVGAEAGRHQAALLSGRTLVRANDPVNAARVLWPEFLRYDTPRTRYALWELYRRYPCVLSIHNDRPRNIPMDVQYSPDGQYLITVWYNGEVQVHAAADGQRTQLLERVAGPVSAIHFIPGHRDAIVAGRDGTLQVWTLDGDGRFSGTEDVAVGHAPGEISASAISASGGRVALGAGREVCVFDRTGGWQLQHAFPSDTAVAALALSTHDTKLAVGTQGQPDRGGLVAGAITIWDLATGTVDRRLLTRGHVRSLRFVQDERQLLSGADCVELHELDLGASKELSEAGRWGVRSLDVSPDPEQRLVAYAFGDGLVCFYDRQLQAQLPIAGYHMASSSPVAVRFAPDGGRLASAGPDGARVWLLPSGDGRVREAPLGLQLEKAVLSADGSHLLVNIFDTPGHVIGELIWSDGAQEPLQSSARLPTRFSSLSPDGSRFARVELLQPGIHQVSVLPTSFSPAVPIARLEVAGAVQCVEWIGSSLLALACKNAPAGGERVRGELQLWSVDGSAAQVATLGEFESSCEHVATSVDGRWLVACASGDGGVNPPVTAQVGVWERLTPGAGTENDPAAAFVRRLEFRVPRETWFGALLQNPDGRIRVATAGPARVISLWDPASGRSVGELRGHRDALDGLCALPDGMLLSVARDRTVRVWDPWCGEETCLLYQGRERPFVSACAGRITIVAGRTVEIAELGDVQRFINANRGAPEALLAMQRRSEQTSPAGRP